MGISGRISTKHLFTHCHCIVKEFGWRTYWSAWKVSFKGGTFLEAVMLAQSTSVKLPAAPAKPEPKALVH